MQMEGLLKEISTLKKSQVGELVEKRSLEFKKAGKGSDEEIFGELCFCILTANFNAEKTMAISEKLGRDFIILPKEELAVKLRGLGHRFPNTRAGYICEARRHKNSVRKVLEKNDGKKAREWLAENVKGLGYKEGSHFLRNAGFGDVSIIDFHIIDLLARFGLHKKTKTLTRKKYLEIEEILENLARKSNIDLGRLDLYLWYMETGKVLK
ncbi:N-glycosylase/DNA lyase [Candidatus Micrarchaeota archaeon]|nr:N-glycosylase/DNA lyase [Candidatus Micrarchaeota archaeon]